MKLNNKFLSNAFIFFISIPFLLNWIVQGDRDGEILASENHSMTKFSPLTRLTQHELLKFFENKELYISDRLLLKDFVNPLLLKYTAEPKYFSNSADISSGIIASDGWLFIGDRFGLPISKHFSTIKPDAKIIKKTVDTLNALKKTADSLNSKYIVLVAPDKHSIYCEKFPKWILKNTLCSNINSYTKILIASIQDSGINVVFPFTELRQSRNDEQLYYKNDTHWNFLGASIAFESFLKGIQLLDGYDDKLNFNNSILIKSNETYEGDLIKLIGVSGAYSLNQVVWKFHGNTQLNVIWQDKSSKKIVPFSKAAQTAKSDFFAIVQNDKGKIFKRVVVLGDSFATALSPFFNLYFKEVTYISRYSPKETQKDLIQKIRPDIIVEVIVERLLDDL